MLFVLCVLLCLSICGLCVCVHACAWLWIMSAPISWESLQVSWELGCFCLWFDPGKGGAKPKKLPPETPVYPLPPGPGWGASQGERFSCFSRACLTEAVSGMSFIQFFGSQHIP